PIELLHKEIGKMMTIYTPQGKELRQIPDDEFFKHITAMELLDLHPEYDEETSGWSFNVCSDAIKMRRGNQEDAQVIPLGPDIDINRFKKYWYLGYCKVHGYTVAGDIQ